MDTFGNNGKLPVDPVDPIDWRLVDQLSEQCIQEYLWQKEDALLLQDVLCNNSAAAVAEGDIFQGDHQQAAANVSAMQALSQQVGGFTLAQKMIEIQVEFQKRPTNKRSHRTFPVDPTHKVAVLRVLLESKKVKLPESCVFAYRMRVLNENKSFLDQGMVDVGVLNLDVLDNASNNHRQVAPNVYAMQTLSEPVGGSTSAPQIIEIKVELWERLADKKIQYKIFVNLTNKVSVLKVHLVNVKAELPEGYLFSWRMTVLNGLFSYHMTVLNEDKSFLDQGMVGLGVPTLDVLDNVTNFSRH